MTTTMKTLITLTTAVVALEVAGCATTPVRSYEPLQAAANQPVDDRWHSLLAVAGEDGWKIEFSDEDEGLLVALRADPATPDLRDRISITLREGQSVIAVQTEMFGRGAWWTTEAACGSYAHAREKELFTHLAKHRGALQLASVQK